MKNVPDHILAVHAYDHRWRRATINWPEIIQLFSATNVPQSYHMPLRHQIVVLDICINLFFLDGDNDNKSREKELLLYH